MGDHWGALDLGTSTRLSLLRHIDREQGRMGGSSGQSSRLSSTSGAQRMALRAVRGAPQAMVKVIRKGGTGNARGMRDQMSYLQKDGDAALERSEAFFGLQMGQFQQNELISAWGLDVPTTTQSDKTTHFVVSFPSDTDHEAAYRAGRAWAEELFASGSYGDVFDYYTAFHTDRAHPHLHVIVNRRGMENDSWLKVSKRSLFNYDELRIVQAETASREGIELEASPRHARGLTDRPIPDAEVRRARQEERLPARTRHTPITIIRSAALLIAQAQQAEANSALLKDAYPRVASRFSELSALLRRGVWVAQTPDRSAPQKLQNAIQYSEFIMSRRSEILDGIEQIDTELAAVPNGAERVPLERDASRIKAEASKLMPDVAELRDSMPERSLERYRGMAVVDATDAERKELADREVAAFAIQVGVEPSKFLSRYQDEEGVPKALADRWRKDELEDIQKNLSFQDRSDQTPVERLAQTAYDDLHRSALQTYRQAERDLTEHAAKRRELQRIARLVRQVDHLEGSVQPLADADIVSSVREVLHPDELKRLERGDANALAHVVEDQSTANELARRYMQASLDEASPVRRQQLDDALRTINRQAQQEAELQRLGVQRGRSNDAGFDL